MRENRSIHPGVAAGLAALLGGAGGVTVQAGAADGPQAGVQEVVITAERSTATPQRTPASISAVSGQELEARGITDVTTLIQGIPGVSLKSEGPGQTEIVMRGMAGSGGNSPTVGFYLDDIPLTPPAGAQNGKVVISPDLYDLERLEVLRGPQGTQYGAGAMGGSIRLITTPPDPSGFHASARSLLSATEGGGFNHSDSLMLNLPLVPGSLTLRLVGTYAATSGWITRVLESPFPVVTGNGATRGDVLGAPVIARHPGSNAQQLQGVRATLLWSVNDRLSITPLFMVQTQQSDGISAYDSTPGNLAHYQPFDIAEPLSDRITIAGVKALYRLDALDVSATYAYWSRRSRQVQDGSEDLNNPQTGATYAANNGLPNPGYYGPDGSGAIIGREDDPSAQTSAELRLTSRQAGPFSWVAGAFFSHYRATWNFNGTSANPGAYMDLGTFQRATTDQWFDAFSPTTIEQRALFADGGWQVTGGLRLGAGLRAYGYDYRFSSTISGWGSGLGAATPSQSGLIRLSQGGANPRINLSYAFDDERMVYATIAKGSRPGGGNAQYPVTGPYWSAVFAPYRFAGGRWPDTYRPDSVWSYELGARSQWLERRLTVNASAYHEDWRNIQLLAFPGDWALNINGRHASIEGADLDVRAGLAAGLVLAVSAGYTHASVDPGAHWQITPADVLPDVAPVNGNVSLAYSRPLSARYTLSSRVEYAYVGPRYSLDYLYGHSLNGEYTQLPSYGLANLRLAIASDRGWEAGVFVSNLLNRHPALENLFQETLPSAAFNRVVTGQPLTAGIDLRYRR